MDTIILLIIIMFWFFGVIIYWLTLDYKNLDDGDIMLGIMFTFLLATGIFGWYNIITGNDDIVP